MGKRKAVGLGIALIMVLLTSCQAGATQAPLVLKANIQTIQFAGREIGELSVEITNRSSQVVEVDYHIVNDGMFGGAIFHQEIAPGKTYTNKHGVEPRKQGIISVLLVVNADVQVFPSNVVALSFEVSAPLGG